MYQHVMIYTARDQSRCRLLLACARLWKCSETNKHTGGVGLTQTQTHTDLLLLGHLRELVEQAHARCGVRGLAQETGTETLVEGEEATHTHTRTHTHTQREREKEREGWP